MENEGMTLEGLENALAGADEAQETNPESKSESDNDPKASGTESSEGTEGTESSEESGGDPEKKEEEFDIASVLGGKEKDHKAFAEMRVQNKKQAAIIGKIAETLGFDAKNANADELIGALNETLLRAKAEQNKVPVELLQRLETLEANNMAFMAEKAKSAATDGLMTIRNKYGASQEDLVGFINKLTEEGHDPMSEVMDLESEYIKRNFNSIIENRINAAIKEEAERREKQETHATTPDGKKGKDTSVSGRDAVTTVAELTSLLST